MDQTGRGRGRWIEGSGSRVPPLALNVRQVVESGGLRQFHRCYKGHLLFVSVRQNNHNRLHTNPNYNGVQDSTNSTYNTIVL